jgi:uncharacterized protein Yka (UPF0111/DUF47 family)
VARWAAGPKWSELEVITLKRLMKNNCLKHEILAHLEREFMAYYHTRDIHQLAAKIDKIWDDSSPDQNQTPWTEQEVITLKKLIKNNSQRQESLEHLEKEFMAYGYRRTIQQIAAKMGKIFDEASFIPQTEGQKNEF